LSGSGPGPFLGRADTSAARRSTHLVVFGVGLAVAVVLRLALLPSDGLRGDLDQFVLWVHGLTTQPFGQAYDQNLSFPPVMVYIWGLLATLEPAFRTVTDGADPMIRAIMKAPASLADIVIGLLVAWELRDRPRWAVVAGLGILLHPAVIDVSAWWGQYESIYALFGLIAWLFAVRGHSLAAAAVLGVALMTKPQALPFFVPFAAWFLARDGFRGAALAGIAGAAVVAVLWLPFVAAGGPAGYARNLGEYQGDIFAVLSLRAWNAWWLVQEAWAGGQFVLDQTAIIGPLTFRHLGYLAAGALEVVVFAAVYLRPTPESLALGLAAAVLVAFAFLTTMHERYAYGAVVFLAMLIADRRILATWLILGVVFTLNLLAAAPPTPDIGEFVPVSGSLAIIGSFAMLGVTITTLALLFLPATGETAEAPNERNAVPMKVVG
jgi:dolichyl-phosphate-mannose-protein mannosyltransferase